MSAENARALKGAAERAAIVYALLAAGLAAAVDADVDIAVAAIERAGGIVGHPYTPPHITEVLYNF